MGQYGELTVDQARTMAQEWLAEVRKGGDPSAAKNAARKAPTMKEFCHTFMGYRGVEVPGVQIIHRGRIKSLSAQARRLLNRRQAVEPVVGHLKDDCG